MKTFTTIVALVAMLSAANAATIADLAGSTPDLSILVQAVTAANFLDPLMDPNARLTVFAPNDAAFEQLLAVLDVPAEELLADTETLATVLQYHVVPAVAFSTDLTDGQVIPTLLGATLTVTINDDGVFITPTGGPMAQVVAADIAADNGVVHIIDTVLLPAAAGPVEETMAAPTME
ncbi:hypothetical protein Ndes2526B_g07407 [Nannochloris sp. 'desiccata']|nr:hypothetical protein KSW81_004590 [Chlorella desiccata (nom. nud.)]KAH7618463.1 hypothetical protein NADE_000655 [Chlorella desiccata (nom. nud.)]